MTVRAVSGGGEWPFTTRSTAWRLFITTWILFTLHFAPNIVREIYPALSIGDHLSFRVDEYADLHPDLFETEGHGWHIGNNPGASMVAAIPYAIARPAIAAVTQKVIAYRASEGLEEPPGYESPWPLGRRFYAEAWRRGLDVKLGLAALVMQAFCMAVTSALAAVLVFLLFRSLLGDDRKALWLSMFYAVGTPVLFRTAFLNHNLMLGHIAFTGFVVLWNPNGLCPWKSGWRYGVAGLAGGAAVLFDYSGLVFLLSLFLYAAWRQRGKGGAVSRSRAMLAFAGAAAIPIALLWFYQWRSFGNPFLPGQHWMPHVEWSDMGYQGYGAPQLELLLALVIDYRFGLLVTSPFLALAFVYPFLRRRSEGILPLPELVCLLATFIGLWLFFAGSNYTRLQYNTGLRYMAPVIPFLFLPAALVLVRLRRIPTYLIGGFSVILSWALAMYRDVESGFGVARPVIQLFVNGFQLPVLQSLSYVDASAYGGILSGGTSPLPLFTLAGALIWLVWQRFPQEARYGCLDAKDSK